MHRLITQRVLGLQRPTDRRLDHQARHCRAGRIGDGLRPRAARAHHRRIDRGRRHRAVAVDEVRRRARQAAIGDGARRYQRVENALEGDAAVGIGGGIGDRHRPVRIQRRRARDHIAHGIGGEGARLTSLYFRSVDCLAALDFCYKSDMTSPSYEENL